MFKLFLQFLVALPIAIAAGIGLLVFFALMLTVLNHISIARERHPLSTVRAFFGNAYPNSRISWIRLAANEPDRDVVLVFYGRTRPPRCKGFAVACDGSITELDDFRRYAPRHIR